MISSFFILTYCTHRNFGKRHIGTARVAQSFPFALCAQETTSNCAQISQKLYDNPQRRIEPIICLDNFALQFSQYAKVHSSSGTALA